MIVAARGVAKAVGIDRHDVFPFSNENVPLLSFLPGILQWVFRRLYCDLATRSQTFDRRHSRAGPLLTRTEVMALVDMPRSSLKIFARVVDLASLEPGR